MSQDDFVSRVIQLRANCDSPDRLQDIVDRTSGRGPEVPQDVVTQHHFVCQDVVADLTLPAGVSVASDQ
jgi:hypothetical protein